MSRRTQRRKHQPQRTCVACRTVRPKRELVRVVRTPEGRVMVDDTGKRSGRGAYLCRQRLCWETALAQRRLNYALKTTLTPEAETQLREYAARFPPAQGGHGEGESGEAAKGGSRDE